MYSSLNGNSLRKVDVLAKRLAASTSLCIRSFAVDGSDLPESLTRIGVTEIFPNEYPGQNYGFNWCLNGDGVTPVKKAAFRMTKPLDIRIAGLEVPTAKIDFQAAAPEDMPEAGSDELDFDTFDEIAQRTKDLLSLSEKIFCPEGDFPGSRNGVRVITNSPSLAPQLLSYLERAPRRDPESQLITAYVMEGTEEEFAGYAIEEIEEEDGEKVVAVSVADVVVMGEKPKLDVVIAGLNLSQEGLVADEAERAAKRAEDADA
eukprot:CAMPEP_0194146674 /NCGR_PEP_ID=MMETSP0152-20130528/21284_1 /TAXON_ID=1049557 /ORGANISM="Thalassiothrix antarctica, Strain L6-D1" /LENGTH=259 /DNA_ID=CAMNT_0038847245 /DNA_START=16 /DNA_END=795 /DNA_ORIENTATION=+